MSTSKRLLSQFGVTSHGAKRLSQLANGRTPNYGVAMGALVTRGLVEVIDGEHQITEEGRKTIEGLRAAGW